MGHKNGTHMKNGLDAVKFIHVVNMNLMTTTISAPHIDVTIAIMKNVKDFIEEIKDAIEWILNGCPQPVPIPVKDDENERRKRN